MGRVFEGALNLVLGIFTVLTILAIVGSFILYILSVFGIGPGSGISFNGPSG